MQINLFCCGPCRAAQIDVLRYFLTALLFHTAIFLYQIISLRSFLLYQVTAGLLDVVYPSEDKDKVSPLLVNILTRVFPYLKNHRYLDRKCYQFVMSTFICHTLFVYDRV